MSTKRFWRILEHPFIELVDAWNGRTSVSSLTCSWFQGTAWWERIYWITCCHLPSLAAMLFLDVLRRGISALATAEESLVRCWSWSRFTGFFETWCGSNAGADACTGDAQWRACESNEVERYFTLFFIMYTYVYMMHFCTQSYQSNCLYNFDPFYEVRHNADLALESCIQQDLWHSQVLVRLAADSCIHPGVNFKQNHWWQDPSTFPKTDAINHYSNQVYVDHGIRHFMELLFCFKSELRNWASEPTQRSLLWDVRLVDFQLPQRVYRMYVHCIL